MPVAGDRPSASRTAPTSVVSFAPELHRMAERDERRLIVFVQRREQPAAGAAQLLEPLAGHAVAHVEREDRR